jgi:hypothetical protein
MMEEDKGQDCSCLLLSYYWLQLAHHWHRAHNSHHTTPHHTNPLMLVHRYLLEQISQRALTMNSATTLMTSPLMLVHRYLPKQISAEELDRLASAKVAELGVMDMKGMGKVIGQLKQQLGAAAPGGMISDAVKKAIGAL